jgi:hypothetical protein
LSTWGENKDEKELLFLSMWGGKEGRKKGKKERKKENLPSPHVLNIGFEEIFSNLVSGSAGFQNIVQHLSSLTIWTLAIG